MRCYPIFNLYGQSVCFAQVPPSHTPADSRAAPAEPSPAAGAAAALKLGAVLAHIHARKKRKRAAA